MVWVFALFFVLLELSFLGSVNLVERFNPPEVSFFDSHGFFEIVFGPFFHFDYFFEVAPLLGWGLLVCFPIAFIVSAIFWFGRFGSKVIEERVNEKVVEATQKIVEEKEEAIKQKNWALERENAAKEKAEQCRLWSRESGEKCTEAMKQAYFLKERLDESVEEISRQQKVISEKTAILTRAVRQKEKHKIIIDWFHQNGLLDEFKWKELETWAENEAIRRLSTESQRRKKLSIQKQKAFTSFPVTDIVVEADNAKDERH